MVRRDLPTFGKSISNQVFPVGLEPTTFGFGGPSFGNDQKTLTGNFVSSCAVSARPLSFSIHPIFYTDLQGLLQIC